MPKPKPARTAAAPPWLPLQAFTSSHGHAVTTWMSLNRAVIEGFGKLQQETSRFLVQRIEDDLARQQQMLTSRSPEEFWQAWADFANQAVRDYSDEAERLSGIAADMQYACTGFGELLAADATAPRAEDA